VRSLLLKSVQLISITAYQKYDNIQVINIWISWDTFCSIRDFI